MEETDTTLWFALRTTTELALFETLVPFKFVQFVQFIPLTVDVFPVVMIKIELRTCYFQETKLIVSAMQVYFTQCLLESKASNVVITMIYICARFYSVVLQAIFKSQVKYWMDFHSIVM